MTLEKLKNRSLNKDYTVTESMALCDIYNIDTGHKVVERNKVGF